MRRIVIAASFGSLAIAIAAACSSFDGAASDPTDAAGMQESASSEADTPDTAPVVVPPYCTTVDAAFCWSFDENPFFAPNNGELKILATDKALAPGKSAPNGLRLRSDGGFAYASHGVDAGVRGLRCHGVIRPDDAGTGYHALSFALTDGVVSVTFVLTDLNATVSLRATLNVAQPDASPTLKAFAAQDFGGVPYGDWVELDLAIDVDAQTFEARAGDASASVSLPNDAGLRVQRVTEARWGISGLYGSTPSGVVTLDDLSCVETY